MSELEKLIKKFPNVNSVGLAISQCYFSAMSDPCRDDTELLAVCENAANDYVELHAQLRKIKANYDALQSPMPCGHLARYAVNGEDGTQYCCMCLVTETQKENGVLRRYIAKLEDELDEQ